MIEGDVRYCVDPQPELHAVVSQWFERLRKRARIVLCLAVNGEHELHRAHSESKLFQRCVCGYETVGWTIDRRDRRRVDYTDSRVRDQRLA